MNEIDRRTAIKLGTAAVVGIATSEFMLHLRKQAEKTVEKISGHPTGNTSEKVRIEEVCKNSENPQECVQNFEYSTEDKIISSTIIPVAEELMYRATPSLILSIYEDSENPITDIIYGINEDKSITRRELIVGTASSLVFGAIHNITSKGTDTNTIPVGQTLGGFAYWYLQRKFGIVASTLAHSWNNFRYVLAFSDLTQHPHV